MGIKKESYVMYDKVIDIEEHDGTIGQVEKIVTSISAITCVRWYTDVNDDDSFGTIWFYDKPTIVGNDPILEINPGEAIVIGTIDNAFDISVVEYTDDVKVKQAICHSPLRDLVNEGGLNIESIRSIDDFEKIFDELFEVDKIPDDCLACEDRPTCDAFDTWKDEHPDEYAAQKAAYKAGKKKAKEE